MNSNLSLLQSFVSEQFICIKKTLEEIIDLYQRNENTSTYTTALIKKTDDLKEENKMKNRTIKSLFEHNNAVLWQRKDQIVAIENTPSKNVIVSNFEETVSAHIILAETPNVKEDMKENTSDIPKNNTPENVNDLPIYCIEAVDRNTITDDNNSISNNIPASIPNNIQLIDFMVSDNILNNNPSSNDNDALSNMTSMDTDGMLTGVWKNTHKEYISYLSTEHSRDLCVSITRKAKRSYYKSLDLKEITDSKKFWATVKPLLSNKIKSTESITLEKNEKNISNDKELASNSNEFFVNILPNLSINANHSFLINTGNENDPIAKAIAKYKNHPCIISIKRFLENSDSSFQHFPKDKIIKTIKKLDPKKVVQSNDIPTKLIKSFSGFFSDYVYINLKTENTLKTLKKR